MSTSSKKGISPVANMHSREPVYLTQNQIEMLRLLEEKGLSDPERVSILADIVKQAAAWGHLKKWLIQTGAVCGAGAALWAFVQLIRSLGGHGPG